MHNSFMNDIVDIVISMDKSNNSIKIAPVTENSSDEGPAVVGANWYRFRPEERIRHECVAGVCYLWIVSGSGTVTSRGRSFAVGAHDILRLPWRHDVSYLADRDSPFFVGTMYLVPRYRTTAPIVPRVAYQPDDPLLDSPWRLGDPGDVMPLLNGVEGSVARGIVTLGSYCIEMFTEGAPKESSLRALGVLLAELDERWREHRVPTVALPNRLRLMTEYVLARFSDPSLTVDEISAAAGCSPATARRLFRTHLGQPVLGWVRERRLVHAAVTLRTTGLRVREVARMVGFSDPLYFSRAFSERFGVSPSRYASEELRP